MTSALLICAILIPLLPSSADSPTARMMIAVTTTTNGYSFGFAAIARPRSRFSFGNHHVEICLELPLFDLCFGALLCEFAGFLPRLKASLLNLGLDQSAFA